MTNDPRYSIDDLCDHFSELKISDVASDPKRQPGIHQRPGTSGGIEVIDAVCDLPENLINSRIYAAFWFLLVLLAIMIFVTILLRLFVFLLFSKRGFWLRHTQITIYADGLTVGYFNSLCSSYGNYCVLTWMASYYNNSKMNRLLELAKPEEAKKVA